MESSTAIPKLITKMIAVDIFKSIPKIAIIAEVMSSGTTLGTIEINVILKDRNNRPTISPISAMAKTRPSITFVNVPVLF